MSPVDPILRERIHSVPRHPPCLHRNPSLLPPEGKTAMLMPRLPVPELRVPTLAHGDYLLTSEAPGNFSLVVFYRGLHCPICLKYLLELARLLPEFDQRGVKVIAISSDTRERAQALAD